MTKFLTHLAALIVGILLTLYTYGPPKPNRRITPADACAYFAVTFDMRREDLPNAGAWDGGLAPYEENDCPRIIHDALAKDESR